MDTEKNGFSVISLGCSRTLVDTEKMVESLQNGGFSLKAEGSGEPITILNTCSFIQAAIDETEANIQALSEKKRAGDLKYLVVTGCYPSRFKKPELESKFPDVDLWLTTKEEPAVQAALSQLVFKSKYQPQQAKPYVKLTPSHYAYLKISEGCNNWCTFCTIPKIRGQHTSKPLGEILEEAKRQISFGAKELILTAEDTTAWGEDMTGSSQLPQLLSALSELPVEWIRPMYIYPSRVDDALIEVIRSKPNIVNYMDMPIQHVSTDILDKMRRRHDKAFLETLMTKLFREIPDFTFRTTFILGFPGETEAHVDEIIDFIERYPVHQLGCFPYSKERETLSSRMPDMVPEDVIHARIRRVMTRQYELVQERNKKRIGQDIKVLYEGGGIGRTYQEAPEVDGVVRFENPDSLFPGLFYNAKIIDFSGYDLNVEVIGRCDK